MKFTQPKHQPERAVLLLTGIALAWRLIAMVMLPDTWVSYSFDASAVLLLTGCSLAVLEENRSVDISPQLGWLALVVVIALPMLVQYGWGIGSSY